MSRRSSSRRATERVPLAAVLRNGALRKRAAVVAEPTEPEPGIGPFGSYMAALSRVVAEAAVTDAHGRNVDIEVAVKRMGRAMRTADRRGNRIFFVGNGGSAGICSHMAADYSKNGGMRASSLNDGAVLTCLANDFGYEHVFSKQLEWQARKGDMLVAISSSGQSPNILNAAEVARNRGCQVFTFSGFGDDNPLRRLGDLNIYLASRVYGFVEIGHEAILHGVLDIQMGWPKAQGATSTRRPRAAAAKLNGAAN